MSHMQFIPQARPILFILSAKSNCYLHYINRNAIDKNKTKAAIQYKINKLYLLNGNPITIPMKFSPIKQTAWKMLTNNTLLAKSTSHTLYLIKIFGKIVHDFRSLRYNFGKGRRNDIFMVRYHQMVTSFLVEVEHETHSRTKIPFNAPLFWRFYR